MSEFTDLFAQARELSWKKFGKRITFYLPGLFTLDGVCGEYPAVSITGSHCALRCDHCSGKILDGMICAGSGDHLLEKCLHLEEKGCRGVLISGGCDEEGRLPWEGFIPAIREIKSRTNLYLSIHCGLVTDRDAHLLKEAGVDQALIDVIGDDVTYRDIYHVPFGVSRIADSLGALERAGLPIVPHIVCGLHYGKMRGEWDAVRMISRFHVEQLVVVSLMRIPGTPAFRAESPPAEGVAGIIAEARMRLPDVRISLGCARQRGNPRLETLAIDAGVNRMALPSDDAVGHALKYGLEVRYQRTCCSISRDCSQEVW
jgi:lipoyl synthase